MALIPARLRHLRSLDIDRVRGRIADERRNRVLSARVERDVTPPPPGMFGRFGVDSVIVPPARVTNPQCIFIGDDVRIHEHAWISVVQAVEGITPRLSVGNSTSIGRFAHIACVGDIEIGADVLASERVFIGDTYHGYEDVSQPVIRQPMATPEKVTIGWGAFLGIGSIVLAGVTVGEQAYVGAGAVVTSNVDPRTVVAGNPARVVRRWDDSAGDWVSAVG